MTDRPILFSGPMVRAILDGRKTQTRRVLNPQPPADLVPGPCDWVKSGWALWKPNADPVRESCTCQEVPIRFHPGDRLYVREAWHAECAYEDTPPRDIPYDACQVLYAADQHWSEHDPMARAGRLRPGMHMPRWASRLTLTVSDVRVQRLQEISEADAIAEGVDLERYVPVSDSAGLHSSGEAEPTDPVEEFRNLWDSLNAKRGYGWEANPWVVAITFEAHRQNIDQMGAA